MSLDAFKRIDHTKLYPPFYAALEQLIFDAWAQGYRYWCISGYRSYSEQQALYNQGRNTPGPVVTSAMAGQSSHNFGISVDVCLDDSKERSGLQPNYKPESYEPLRVLSTKHGLVWGGGWKIQDYSHLQLPNYVTSTQLEPLRYAYELAGLPSVFEYLQKGASNAATVS